ncbi:response regulator transcription factor [Aliikangiella sp. G2MR2-5]|uniref:response regulator transcription factor n=1 Tax=Aliikangiella sp. G2MR2-5 TaxID=2788943 RepID=UPI0018ABD00D|nr:response regulator [Aliikangiella sp. G2MR2-5]
MSLPTICYLDDCESNLLLIKKSLSEDYDVVTLDSPENAVEELLSIKPRLILLDVNMPDTDGYQICRELRKQQELSNTPVIFLTCRSSLEDRLTGFEAGGDAYITKPYELAELKYIVQSQLLRHQNLIAAENKADLANEMVFVMMKNNSEIGQVIQYARALSQTKEEVELLDNTFSVLNDFGLNSTILLRLTAGEIVARSDKKPFTPIEEQLLQLARDGQRIVCVGCKYVFTGNHSVFLIKNMPTDDADLTGRLRDHLAIMLESCDACIELINYRHKEKIDREKIANKAESTVMQEFNKIISINESLNQKAQLVFDQLATNIEESFMFLGLTEEQELQLTEYIESARKEINQYMDAGYSLQEALCRVADSVHELTL